MRTISAAFAAQLRRGFTLASLVEVRSSDGTLQADSADFSVVSGNIMVDGAASIQRRLDNLVVVDNSGELVPDEATDLFSVVSNNELWVYTGMVIPGSADELLLQGKFGLEGCEVEDGDGGLSITLSAYDRARQISRAKLVVPQKLAASNPPTTTAITTATALITAARPGTQVKLAAPDPGLGHPEIVLDEGTDPWEAARKIISDIGWELFMDWDGQARMQPVVDPNRTSLVPVWTYAEGVDSTLLRVVRGFSNEEAFNGQVVTGESTGNLVPARGIAWDDDPASPTYYLGAYGQVPEFYQSELIRTDAQATAVATARLNQRKGANERMVFGIVPNHAHEYCDVATIARAKSKVNRGYLIDAFGMSLGAAGGAMSITTRQRKA